MDTYKDAVVLNDLWGAWRAPLDDIWESRRCGGTRERSLVTGAHGFVGSHLARALLERGDEVRVLDRPAPRRRRRRRALGARPARDPRRGRAGRGRPARAERGRRRRSAGVDRSSTSPRRRSSGSRRRSRWRPSRSTCVAPGTSSRPAVAQGSPAVVFASSDKAYGASPELPYREDFPLRADLSLRRQQGGRRHDRAQLRARLRAAAGGDPVRQHLRRRRPQLLPADPRGGGRGARRAGAR